MDENPEPKKPASPFASLGGIAGAIGGWTFSQYCGAAVWIPGGTLILLMILFGKTKLRPPYFSGVIAVTTGHLVWFLVGSAYAGAWSAALPDITLLTIGVVWLWVQPSLPPALLLGAVQLASLAYNLYTLSALTFGSPSHRALTAHCVFRLLALVCLVVGYRNWRRLSGLTPPPLPTVAN